MVSVDSRHPVSVTADGRAVRTQHSPRRRRPAGAALGADGILGTPLAGRAA